MSCFIGKRHKKAKKSISDSSERSSISAAMLEEDYESLKYSQHRPTTKLTYHSVWRKFNQFLIQLDHIPETWEERTCYYCTYLVKYVKVQSATVKSYISAIKAKLAADGYNWNNQLILFKSLISACRDMNDVTDDRLPIQRQLLEAMLFELNRMFIHNNNRLFLITLYRTAFLILYYGLMRIGEITEGPHVLKAAHVHAAENKKQYLLLLYSSKTHGKGDRPQKICISLDPIHGIAYCPVEEIKKYISLRPPYKNETEQFLVFSSGAAVKPADVRKILKLILSRLGLNTNNYDTHSFRIGRATDLFKQGVEVETIKKHGRWESDAVFQYLRD